VGLSIQLCAILLSERATLLLSTVQLLGVLTIVLASPKLVSINWPSLFAFIVFTAAIGIATGHTNRKQLQQIDQQHQQLLDHQAQLCELSLKDSLTGLSNRRCMEESFDREIERMRKVNHQLAVIMTDVDRFKDINDTYGHVIGDAVLAFIADFFMKNTRSSDIVCRYGGDEFIIILPECSRKEATERAELMRSSISTSKVELQGRTVSPLTLSFGIAAMPADGLTRQGLIAAADAALYDQNHGNGALEFATDKICNRSMCDVTCENNFLKNDLVLLTKLVYNRCS
jgi:diguanylate cyclase (GGDEF)-like protein